MTTLWHNPLRIDIVSLFPAMCDGFLSESIVGRAQRRGLLDLSVQDPRAWAGGGTVSSVVVRTEAVLAWW